MKPFFIAASFCFCIMILAFSPVHKSKGVNQTVYYFKTNASLFSSSSEKLYDAISNIKQGDRQTIIRAREVLKECRLAYKRIEFFLTYFLASSSNIYNQPNKVEVEEPFMEYTEVMGLQTIEALLFENDPAINKKELLQHAYLISLSANDLHALLFNLQINDKQILESIRLELIRIMTLGITGFDTPELKTGIVESSQALKSIVDVISPYLIPENKESDSVKHYLDNGIEMLDKTIGFDSFDRLDFLINAAIPLQHHLSLFVKRAGLEINSTGVLNYRATSLFAANAITLDAGLKSDKAKISLGKRLFFDKALSENNKRSCASCHQPQKFFTDQLPKSMALDGRSTVQRNAPSLYYVTYQYAQFWDGRAKSLNEQIIQVMENASEMGTNHKIVVKRLENFPSYTLDFKKAFAGKSDAVTNFESISVSLTAYLNTLAPFSSPFDRYINGDRNALTTQQVNGFNLFMGKAQCGTCHFAPIFNGLIPPLYKRTEMEVLGTTKTADFDKPELDPDNGRFNTFPIVYYKGAFKTPTVRNVARTAPYMHNGAFPTLESVLEFYDKGGGVGIGLNVPAQTLSGKPLHLTKTEVDDIIQFLHALTDSYTTW